MIVNSIKNATKIVNIPFFKTTFFKFVSFLFILLLYLTDVSAQITAGSNPLDSIPDILNQNNESNQKDLFDILSKEVTILKKIRPDTIKKVTMGPFFSILPGIGEDLATGLTGGLSSNISFYTDKDKNKISSFLVYSCYSVRNQYWTTINSNIILEKQKLYIVGDWRFYYYPTVTYGLGSSSSFSDAVHINYNMFRLYQYVYREIVSDLFGGVGYHMDYHWNINEFNVNPSIENDFEKYGFSTRSSSSGVSLDILYDSRKNANNPQNGAFFNIQYRDYFRALGSDQDWQSLLIDARKYITFPQSSNNILAFWTYDFFTLKGNPPYLDLPSTGSDAYSNLGRGYVVGRYRGLNLIYLESEYRFPLSRNGLFGGVVFANIESVSEWPSETFTRINPGGGFGLRVKLNKFSKTNFCVDYGFGMEGSRGIFLNLGDVF